MLPRMTETDSSTGFEQNAPSPSAARSPRSPHDAPVGPAAPMPPGWSAVRVVVYSAVVLGIGFAAQLVAMGVCLGLALARDPGLDADARALTLGSDGDVLGAAAIASSLVCTSLVLWLSRRRAPGRGELLGAKAVPPRVALPWVAGIVAVSFGADALWAAFDRSFLTEDWLALASSTDSFALLLVALAIAVPVAEELLFRGLLLEGLRASGVATWLAVTVSAAAWAVIHVQYEPPELAVVFVLGLVLGTARVRTGSIVPPVLSHAAWNAISWAQLLQLQAT